MHSIFAAGDVLFSSRRRRNSRLIRFGTLSPFSHAAVILDESGLVLEAVPPEESGKESDSSNQSFGVRTQTLDEFLALHDKVWLFRRPTGLTPEEAIRLKQAGLAFEGQLYDLPSAVASGLTRIGLVSLTIPAALLIWKLTEFGPQPRLIAIGAALVLPALLLRAASTRSWSHAAARALRLPNWLRNDSQGQFCSRLVCDVYEAFGEPLATYGREPRPKDVGRALKAKGFVETQMKPASRH